MYQTIILNVDELWLKGKNRYLYYRALKEHVRYVVKQEHPGDSFSCRNESQRLVLISDDQPFSNQTLERLTCVPGIFSIVPAKRLPLDLAAVVPALKEELKDPGQGKTMTFKVFTKRSDKSFPQNSMEISRLVGGYILKDFPWLKVDIHRPEIEVELRVHQHALYLSTRKLTGVGGLPWGMSGHLVTMISGGFDSPVASYLMAKRGCRQSFIFFHAYPLVGDEVLDKIRRMVEYLARYQKGATLYIIPFGDLQTKVSELIRLEYRTVVFRRLMIDCATKLASAVSAQALLTGDSLGQVSSQTIHNLALLDGGSTIPILRPLVGLNKMEIIDWARKIGTHDISLLPHDDACAMLSPKHPVIKPDVRYWQQFIEQNDFSQELDQCLAQATIINY
ncbi:MAG: tRNA 4-thiouridine(8) synthase ThiI [Bdellovibrionales bacterium]|jgi:tRNA uracil 4-sulfurtransferase|nr:tRNA 4-thiouridine(8) synthase ThiI [Bdellovibrionales bacterium]MBT3525195.1 tRNA 4-thiouridine(8) synthase ThiI [Bdellovibrionales bacterium]MBT7766548.1 tRNA 4-thiouridine(8) synthase ThiI [Bdellovibrionales bacterium]